MDLITLLFVVLIVCLLVWAARSFGFPAPVQWIIGVVILVILLAVLLNLLGMSSLGTHYRIGAR